MKKVSKVLQQILKMVVARHEDSKVLRANKKMTVDDMQGMVNNLNQKEDSRRYLEQDFLKKAGELGVPCGKIGGEGVENQKPCNVREMVKEQVSLQIGKMYETMEMELGQESQVSHRVESHLGVAQAYQDKAILEYTIEYVWNVFEKGPFFREEKRPEDNRYLNEEYVPEVEGNAVLESVVTMGQVQSKQTSVNSSQENPLISESTN